MARKECSDVLLQPRGEPSTRVGPLMSIPKILQDLGYDPVRIFHEAGFEISQFDDPDKEIPFIAASRLLERCVEASGCEHFGLLVGKHADPSSLGIAGFILRVAENVDVALRGLLRHLDLHDQGGTANLDQHDKIAMLGYEIHLSGVHAQEQIIDISMAVICNIMGGLCGPGWKPSKVLFSHPAPRDEEPYKQFFRAPLRFNAKQSGVIFPSRWLKQRLESADPLLFEFLEKKAAELHSQQAENLLEVLRKFIGITLASGSCTAKAASVYLGMHERTLQRHLGKQGTSFRQELSKIRYEKACGMLAQSKSTHDQIAWALGYSDGTAFNRSFKKWAGVTPAKWRSQHTNH